MIVMCAKVADGRYRVLVHHDQRADLADANGNTLYGRLDLCEVGEWLVALGYSAEELVPD